MKQKIQNENINPDNNKKVHKKSNNINDDSDCDLSTLDENIVLRKSNSTPEKKESIGKSCLSRNNPRDNIALMGLEDKETFQKQNQASILSKDVDNQKQTENQTVQNGVQQQNYNRNKQQFKKKNNNQIYYNNMNGQFMNNNMYIRQGNNTNNFNQPTVNLLTMNNTDISNLKQQNMVSNDNEEKAKEENKQKMQKSKKIQEEYTMNPTQVFDQQIKENFDDLVTGKYDYFIILNILNTNRDQSHVNFILSKLQENFNFYCNHPTAYKVVEASMELSVKTNIYQSYFDFWSVFVFQNSENYKLPIMQYGNYIVSKAIQLFSGWQENQLISIINNNLLEEDNKEQEVCLSSNQYGCLMIQTLIEKYKYHLTLQNSSSLQTLKDIMEKIVNNVVKLSQQQFSNYIVQQVLLKGDNDIKNRIQDIIIEKHFQQLSEDKYGSNVVEKIIESSSDAKRFQILQLIINEKTTLLKDLANDKYGNYVIKKLYEMGTQQVRKELFNQLNSLRMKRLLSEYGNHAINYMEAEHNRLKQQYFLQRQINNYYTQQQYYNNQNYNQQFQYQQQQQQYFNQWQTQVNNYQQPYQNYNNYNNKYQNRGKYYNNQKQQNQQNMNYNNNNNNNVNKDINNTSNTKPNTNQIQNNQNDKTVNSDNQQLQQQQKE